MQTEMSMLVNQPCIHINEYSGISSCSSGSDAACLFDRRSQITGFRPGISCIRTVACSTEGLATCTNVHLQVESNVEWGIKAEDLMIARNRKGEDYLLGSGAFGLVSHVCVS